MNHEELMQSDSSLALTMQERTLTSKEEMKTKPENNPNVFIIPEISFKTILYS